MNKLNLSSWTGIIISLLIAVLSASTVYGAMVQKVDSNTKQIEMIDNKKVDLQRFEDLREDVKEIRSGIDLLLRENR